MHLPPLALALHPICDRASSRYDLGGILVNRKSGSTTASAVATDGRFMAAVQWNDNRNGEPRQDEFSAIIPEKDCKGALAAIRKIPRKYADIREAVLSEAEQPAKLPLAVTGPGTTWQTETEPLEGRFPSWRDVFPRIDETNSVSVCIDPSMLVELLKIAALATTDAARGVTLTMTLDDDTSKPMAARAQDRPLMVSVTHVTGHHDERVCGIVMPIRRHDQSERRGDNEPLLPDWAPNRS